MSERERTATTAEARKKETHERIVELMEGPAGSQSELLGDCGPAKAWSEPGTVILPSQAHPFIAANHGLTSQAL